MNLKSCLASLLAVMPLLLWGQWTPMPTNGLSGSLWDISLYSSTQVTIIGSEGMFYSVDGGTNWIQPSFVSQPNDAIIYNQSRFRKVAHQNNRIVAIGHDTINNQGVIFSGSGSDWKLAYATSIGQQLNGLYLDNNVAWIVGNAGLILAINLNSGSDFTQASNTTRDLYTITKDNIGGDSILLKRGGSSQPSWVVVSNTATVSHLIEASNSLFGIWDSSEVAYYGNGSGFLSFGRYKYPQYFPPQAVKPTCLSNSLGSNISFGTENGIFWGSSGSFQFAPSSANYHIISIAANTFAITANGEVLKTLNHGFPLIPYVYFFAPSGACRDSLLKFKNEGSFSTNYTWLENGSPLQASNSFSPTKTYNTTGTYQITLIGSNGTLQDTFSRNLTIVDPPTVNLPFTVQGALFCKTGVGSVTIQNTVPGVAYRLYSLTDQSYKGSGMGNNGAVVLSTELMTDSTCFLISASKAFTGCEKFFSDTVFYDVETPEARFHVDLTNAVLGETLNLYNFSKEGDAFQWSLGPNATIASAATLNPPGFGYSQTGHQTAQLIATTNNGCADTLVDTTLFVYDNTLLPDECWAFNLLGIGDGYYGNQSTDFLVDAQADQYGNMLVAAHYRNLTLRSREGDIGNQLQGLGSVITEYDRYGIQKWRVILEDSTDLPYSGSPLLHFQGPPSIKAISRSPSGEIYMSAVIEGNALLRSNDGSKVRFRFPADQLGNPDNEYRTILVKYDSVGVIQWYSLQNGLIIKEMVTDSMGNLYLSINEMVFQPNQPEEDVDYISPLGDSTALISRLDTIGNLEYADAAIMKVAANGDFVWQKGFFEDEAAKIDLAIHDLSIDGNNALNWLGLYKSDFNIIAQNGSITAGPSMSSVYSSNLASDAMMGQFDLSGNLNWTTKIACNAYFSLKGGSEIVNDINGNIYLKFNLPVLPICFSTDGSISVPQYHRGNIISYDRAGILRWQAGTFTSGMNIEHIQIGYDQKLYLSAYTSSSSSPHVISLSSRDSVDYQQFDARFRNILLAAYDTIGNLEYFTGINGSNYEEYPEAIDAPIIAGADTSGKLFMAINVYSQGENIPFAVQNDSIYANEIDVVLISNKPNDCGPIYINTPGFSDEYCPGDTVRIPFRVAPPFLNDTNAVFYLSLYDSVGNYPTTLIGMLEDPENQDTIVGVLPNDLFIYETFEFRIYGSDDTYQYNNYSTATFIWDPLPTRPPTDTVVCQGETVVLQTFSSAYQYQWSPVNLVNNPNAKTIFHVADSSVQLIAGSLYECGWSQDTFNIMIGELTASISGDTVLCLGDSIILTASGGDQYQWQDSSFLSQTDIANPWAFPDSNTTFTVIVSDNTPGCSDIDTAQIRVQVLFPPATPSISFDSTATLLQITSAGATTYQWFKDGQLITGANSATYMPSGSGIYQALTSNNTCESDTSSAFNYTATSLDTLLNPWSFAVSPVPSTGTLWLSGSLRGTTDLRISMLDIQGKTVYQENATLAGGPVQHKLALKLPAAVYLLKVQTEYKTWYQKVIISP